MAAFWSESSVLEDEYCCTAVMNGVLLNRVCIYNPHWHTRKLRFRSTAKLCAHINLIGRQGNLDFKVKN